MRLDGIHHISAITADAPGNLDFYTRVLGMRLAAKTVNQDDPGVYHLFYADERGRPGSEMTFFEYPGLPRGRAGSGMVHRVVWRVGSDAALDFWAARLGDEGHAAERLDGAVRFADPEGLAHELVVDHADEPLAAEHPDVPAEHALGGFVGVRAYARAPERSGALLEGLLGARALGAGAYEVRGARRGGLIAFDPPPAERALAGAGTVHHVAWGTTVDDLPRWAERVAAAGVRATGVIDRHWFHSVYFREPSGVLYEIADDGPGFTRDMPLEELGSRLVLPAWLEPRRAEIEARLTPLADPRAARPRVAA
ncbi:VOC family protein [Miltoncostaea marina]|uniref:VOC family protein n=1 Tax=Miltoncostaea marina TaxID=2843215 RepID=UPI001C3C8CA7|nr:VOC family protein [Miltoncostaea marina]